MNSADMTEQILNQIVLTRRGLWYNIETDYEKIEEANQRIIYYNSEKIFNNLIKMYCNIYSL